MPEKVMVTAVKHNRELEKLIEEIYRDIDKTDRKEYVPLDDL